VRGARLRCEERPAVGVGGHALAAGIPTVATNTIGNVEIVRDRETDLLFQKATLATLRVQCSNWRR
jgi:hypothetical protein